MEEKQKKPVFTREEDEDDEEEAQAQVDIWKYMFGFGGLAVMKCAIELGIANAIENHGSPMTLSEISTTLGCDPSLLNRVMRFLTHRKIFKAIPTNQGYPRYAQTPLSRRLIRNGEQSMVPLIMWESSPTALAPWYNLSARVLANGNIPPFEKAHGKDLWQHFATNFAENSLFNEAMACDAKFSVSAILKGCGEAFEDLNTLVDVGGGNGTTLHILTQACPWIQGINFDLPHVITMAPNYNRVKHVAGDMFLSVPKADAILLKWILHDWGDNECIKILKKCREAIPEGNGKVIIVDAVIEEGGKNNGFSDIVLMMDMVMLAHTKSGRERTLKEWEFVIQMAGFSKYTVKAIQAVQSVITAFY
ncbi:hypothetical protein RJT34_02441 [Clitoria ternatea]|uniref:Uncharacterized protein n=1 Tax=Clitoria ternatea TaxID=43366 RepID=A0AAN9KIL6_CLITE